MEIVLDQEEAELLEGILGRYLADLREELHHTDLPAFKADIKTDQALVQKVLNKFSSPGTPRESG